MKHNLFLFMLHCITITMQTSCIAQQTPLYIATAADDRYYAYLINLLGSIHKTNFDDLAQVAVFNLGLTPDQITELNSIAKVCVYEVELTNPELLNLFRTRPESPIDSLQVLGEPNKMVRGWYAWKPVILKQALDMFPYVLYIDSGFTVKQSLTPLFKQIQQHGYFLIKSPNTIGWMSTRHVIEKFNLAAPERQFLLHERGVTAGLQGVSRAVYDSYIMPMYELSRDLKNFMDDGSSVDGFGTARHDQPLFGIQAILCHLDVKPWNCELMINNERVPCYIKDYVHFAKWAKDLTDMRAFLRFK